MTTFGMAPTAKGLAFQFFQGVQQGFPIALYFFTCFNVVFISAYAFIPTHLFVFEWILPHAANSSRNIMRHVTAYINMIWVFSPLNEIFITELSEMSDSHIDNSCGRTCVRSVSVRWCGFCKRYLAFKKMSIKVNGHARQIFCHFCQIRRLL